MTKTKLNDVFAETIKVVEIAQRLEIEMRKEIPDQERLRMVKAAKDKAKSSKELDELEAEEIRLKRKIRFGEIEKIQVPQEKRAIVEKNYEIEKEAARKRLLDRYQKLETYLKQFVEMEELVAEIIELEDKAASASFVQRILDGHVDNHIYLAPELQRLTRFSHGHSLKKLTEKLTKTKSLVGNQAAAGIKRNKQGAK